MEEGELLSSEEELSQAAAAAVPSEMTAVRSHTLYHRASAPVPGLSDTDESSDQDSDSEAPRSRLANKRKYRKTSNNTNDNEETFVNPLLNRPDLIKRDGFPPLPNNNGGRGDNASANKTKRKINNVWGSVVTEQTIVNDLEGVDVMQKANVIDRDVESYSYNDGDFDKQRKVVVADGNVLEVEDVDNPFDDGDLDNVEKLTNPELRQENTFKRDATRDNAKSRLGYRKTGDEEMDDGGDAAENRRRANLKRKAPAKERLGEKVDEGLTHDYALTEDETAVAADISFKLCEQNLEMIELVVVHLGKEMALKFLQMTNSLEESGGMMTQDGSRRRTAGGVYLYLIKNDKSIPKETLAKIFRPQQNLQKKRMRKHKLAKRRIREHDLKNEYEELKRDILEAKRLKDLDQRSQDVEIQPSGAEKRNADAEMDSGDRIVDERAKNLSSMATDDFLDDADICDIEVM
ncbi:uncharacterized protein LOC141906442 isoform X2 [Tubulanus polymorphus]|uniref:uncharacterized protein LOC141906442 isoform X2 n=1 Tax=Tubulanus polymorphus TaxID=672921 RepID=UPI003DA68ACF